jgi:WD40 repeat protein
MIQTVYLKVVFVVGLLMLSPCLSVTAEQMQSQAEGSNLPELVIQTGHSSLVNSVAFSLDGNTLASAGGDNAIKIWDVQTGRQIRSLIGHTSYILSVTFSPDGRLLASGGFDNTVRLWDAKMGTLLRTFEGHTGGIFSVAFARDGLTLASGGFDKTIKLWDIEQGKEVRSFVGHTDVIFSVEFSPDKKSLASGSLDNSIKLWDLSTGLYKTLKGHTKGVWSVSFSSDGKTLASGSPDGTIRLWDVPSGNQTKSLQARTAVLYSVVISPDGKTVASGGENNTVKLWDVATGQEVKSFEGHSSFVKSIAFSKDGQTLVSGSSDNTIRLWDVTTGRQIRTLLSRAIHVLAVAVSAQTKRLATVTFDDSIKLWNLENGQQIKSLEYGPKGTRNINSIVFSPDGKTLVSGHRDDTIRLWDVETGRLSRIFENVRVDHNSENKTPESAGSPSPGTFLTGKWNMVVEGPGLSVPVALDLLQTGENFSGTFSSHAGGGTIPTGKIVGNRISGTVKLEAEGQKIELQLEGKAESDQLTGRIIGIGIPQITFKATKTHGVYSVAYSPDGKIIASGSDDNTIKLWKVATGKPLKTLKGHTQGVRTVAFSPDGTLLASGSKDKTVILWDVSTGSRIRSLVGHAAEISAVVFSPDGTTVASASFDRTIKLWNVGSGESKSLTGHTDQISSITYSSDGRVLASAGDDRTIKLWDIASGTYKTLAGHPKEISGVTFLPGRNVLFSASWDATVRVWNTETDELLATLISLDKNDWVSVTPAGLFEASRNAEAHMHYILSDIKGNYEIIAFDQLKARYYEPKLLARICGFNNEALRDVRKFESPKLHPDVKYQLPAPGSSTLTVTLTNRGGGIGRVQIFVNGKEFLADARDEKLRQNENTSEAILTVDLSRAPSLGKGTTNSISVVAWNVEDYISSRGSAQIWTSEGQSDNSPLEVYAIVGGISSYAGSELNLNYAGKDAVDIANAIELGAKRLYGAEKVHLTLLSTAPDPRAISPTKENFIKAFEAARKARPKDILMIYLAGHGVSLQQGHVTYCFLTREARTTDAGQLADPELRRTTTITSDELVDWVNQIPAHKQVVILDTCAAGAVKKKLADKRELSGDAIRAIDRANGRTGSYILMGSAADSVSYEATLYAQGLLTYALLKGMKGAALRDDEFVDVSKLFQYARDEVGQLAQNIGGIQSPEIFAPKDDSFDVGYLKIEDKLKIVLATPKPIILRPRFTDTDPDGDETFYVKLEKEFKARLRDESAFISRGVSGSVLIFVDDDEFPGGIRPIGSYTIGRTKVSITLRLRRNGVAVGNPQTVVGTKEDVGGLADKILAAVKNEVLKLSDDGRGGREFRTRNLKAAKAPRKVY